MHSQELAEYKSTSIYAAVMASLKNLKQSEKIEIQTLFSVNVDEFCEFYKLKPYQFDVFSFSTLDLFHVEAISKWTNWDGEDIVAVK